MFTWVSWTVPERLEPLYLVTFRSTVILGLSPSKSPFHIHRLATWLSLLWHKRMDYDGMRSHEGGRLSSSRMSSEKGELLSSAFFVSYIVSDISSSSWLDISHILTASLEYRGAVRVMWIYGRPLCTFIIMPSAMSPGRRCLFIHSPIHSPCVLYAGGEGLN